MPKGDVSSARQVAHRRSGGEMRGKAGAKRGDKSGARMAVSRQRTKAMALRSQPGWRTAGPRQTHFGRRRSGDGRFDQQRRRGVVQGRWGMAQVRAGQPGHMRGNTRRGEHGRVANLTGRAGGVLVRVAICRCVCAVVAQVCSGAVMAGVVVGRVLSRFVLVRCGSLRQRQGRQNPRCHGGAREAPKDQHHHEDEKQAATHAVNDTAR